METKLCENKPRIERSTTTPGLSPSEAWTESEWFHEWLRLARAPREAESDIIDNELEAA